MLLSVQVPTRVTHRWPTTQSHSILHSHSHPVTATHTHLHTGAPIQMFKKPLSTQVLAHTYTNNLTQTQSHTSAPSHSRGRKSAETQPDTNKRAQTKTHNH